MKILSERLLHWCHVRSVVCSVEMRLVRDREYSITYSSTYISVCFSYTFYMRARARAPE